MGYAIRRTVMAVTQFLLFFIVASGQTAVAQTDIKSTHPNGEVSVVFDFDVKPGFEAEFETFFKRSIKCARLDPGNVAFNIHKVVGTERQYLAHIIWKSPEAFHSHLQQPYTKQLLAMFGRTLTKPVSEGRRYISNLDPAPPKAPAKGDPSDDPDCR